MSGYDKERDCDDNLCDELLRISVARDYELGFGVLYFNTFLVLGSHYSYLYLKSIYFFSGSTPEVGEDNWMAHGGPPRVSMYAWTQTRRSRLHHQRLRKKGQDLNAPPSAWGKYWIYWDKPKPQTLNPKP